MGATLLKAEKAFQIAIIFPFVVALRYPIFSFNALLFPGFILCWFGPYRLGIMFLVGGVVVSALNLGAGLERLGATRR